MSHLTLKEQLAALAITPSAPSAPVVIPQDKKNQKTRVPTSAYAKKKPAWLEHAQYGIELLKAHFPACFKEPQKIQPLKVGIKQDLVKKLGGKEDITLNDKACMVNSLSYYVSSPAYHRSVFKDAVRIDLEGQPAGVVTAEEAHYSSHSRKEKLQRHSKVVDA